MHLPMKNSVVFLFLLFTSGLLGQIKPKSADWFSYDLTHDLFLDAPGSLTQGIWSNGHSFTFTGDYSISKNFGLGYGLGFHSNNYYNNLRITTNPANGAEVFTTIEYDTVDFNKLTVQYIHLPLELRFRGTPNAKGRFFRFYIGGRVGVRVNSYSQYVTDKVNITFNDLGSLNRFNYGIYGRIGYHYFNVFAYYGISPLFESGSQLVENMGTPQASTFELDQIRTLSVGISFSL